MRQSGYGLLRLWVMLAATLLLGDLLSLQAGVRYRHDRLLVQPKAGRNSAGLQALHARHGVMVLKRFDRIGGLEILSVPPTASIPQLLAEYRHSLEVEFAEPDYLVKTSMAPNDPKYLDGTLWGLNKIQAAAAWEVLTSASNVVVAVVDTGVRYTHQDLTANMWTNPVDGTYGFNALTGSNDPNDDNGHGTMVAGILGAVGNNALGIVGVAWKVQIMACKSFDRLQVGSISTCIASLDFARSNHAQIVNASWGFATNSLALSNAVYSLRAAGILLVAAAGNAGQNLDVQPVYPACYELDNVLSVAYTTPLDALAGPSNFGSTNVHLAAPGEQIYSTFGATDSFYLALSGSSFAAPYVSGALALLRAQHPEESHQQLRARLLAATDKPPALAGRCLTGGRLNLRNALSPALMLSCAPGSSNSMQWLLSADPNRTCVIETSPDLATWSPILTNTTSLEGNFEFDDPFATNFAHRFYRAKVP